ncbi:MAG: hypothetical protein LUF31_08465 [Fusobacterium sp.]|nr:hypothetical protein [Fusobacterium sp.]
MELKQLIDNAEQIKNKDNIKKTRKVIKIKRFEQLGMEDPCVMLEKPATTVLLLARKKESELYILSESMISPDLGNKELQKAFGTKSREVLLKKIFTEEELQDLMTYLGEMIEEKNTARLEDDIKN